MAEFYEAFAAYYNLTPDEVNQLPLEYWFWFPEIRQKRLNVAIEAIGKDKVMAVVIL